MSDLNTDQGFFLVPAPHEIGANLIYADHGLTPYFALDSVVKKNGGSKQAKFSLDGENWVVKLNYDDSNLEAWDADGFDIENVREYKFYIEALDDDVGERSGTIKFSPRAPYIESKSGCADTSFPEDLEGLNAHVQASNIQLDEYPRLIRLAADALDINSKYFDELHSYSNIYTFELYARILREKSGPVYGMGSPMARIFQFVDGFGKYRELREDNRKIEGYHYRVRMDSGGSAGLIPGHSLGKQIKHYHPKHPRNSPRDPLYHPKLGVAFKSNLNTDGAVAWSDRHELRKELKETIINILHWSSMPVQPNGDTYRHDEYFDVADAADQLTLIEDPTESLAYDQLAQAKAALFGDESDPADAGLNSTGEETAKVLADGGTQDVDVIAEEIGKSKRTVYRVLDALGDVITNRAGTVSFASDFLREQFQNLLSGASETVQKDSDSGGSSAWSAYLARYGPSISDLPGDSIELDFGHVDSDVDMHAVVRKGLTAWMRSGRERNKFLFGIAHWVQDGDACRAGSKVGKMDLPGKHSRRVSALD